MSSEVLIVLMGIMLPPPIPVARRHVQLARRTIIAKMASNSHVRQGGAPHRLVEHEGQMLRASRHADTERLEQRQDGILDHRCRLEGFPHSSSSL